MALEYARNGIFSCTDVKVADVERLLGKPYILATNTRAMAMPVW